MFVTEYNLVKLLKKYSGQFHPVVQFNPAKEKLIQFDFTEHNEALAKINIADTGNFCKYIEYLLENAGAKFGIGGYNELRILYAGSTLFDKNINQKNPEDEEPRRLHLGIDIWGRQGTEIFAPVEGLVHSFAFNDHFGDYGATIILSHQIEDIKFFTLYGHVSLVNLHNINEGDFIPGGQQFAHFGSIKENGHWPPHLHFQVIHEIENYIGDYPGVCKYSEREKYLSNSPDAGLMLNMVKFIS